MVSNQTFFNSPEIRSAFGCLLLVWLSLCSRVGDTSWSWATKSSGCRNDGDYVCSGCCPQAGFSRPGLLGYVVTRRKVPVLTLSAGEPAGEPVDFQASGIRYGRLDRGVAGVPHDRAIEASQWEFLTASPSAILIALVSQLLRAALDRVECRHFRKPAGGHPREPG